MERHQFTQRITLDLDNNAVRSVQVYRSASGKGNHVVIELEKPITFYQQFMQRILGADDPKRLNASIRDLGTGFNPDILFTHKKIKGKWKKRKLLGEINIKTKD